MKILLKTREAAEALGTTEGNLVQMRYRKIGPPFVRLGDNRAVRYPVAELEKWIAGRLVVDGATVQLP